jgi:hypothetical protein
MDLSWGTSLDEHKSFQGLLRPFSHSAAWNVCPRQHMAFSTCAIVNSFGFLIAFVSVHLRRNVLVFLDLPFSFVFLCVLCGLIPFPIPISVISENQRSDFSDLRGCPILCRSCKGWDFTPPTQPHAVPSVRTTLPSQPCGTPAVRTEESAPLRVSTSRCRFLLLHASRRITFSFSDLDS